MELHPQSKMDMTVDSFSKYLSLAFKLSTFLGGLYFVLYCLHLDYFPTGISIGDSIFFYHFCCVFWPTLQHCYTFPFIFKRVYFLLFQPLHSTFLIHLQKASFCSTCNYSIRTIQICETRHSAFYALNLRNLVYCFDVRSKFNAALSIVCNIIFTFNRLDTL